MTNLKYGSSGEEVTKLQNALISAGYDVGSTGADGVYGTNTTSSTPASGTTTNTATTTTTPEASTTPSTTSGFKYNEFTYENYTPSDAVNQANALLQQQQANNPGSYSPIWKDEADSYLSQYQNRDQFSYNFNEDVLYNQYKDNYLRQGQMAMMDTMGQAQAMTGGYGNSYAQSVGQQAYQGYLQELNNVVPELWQLARENYDREGQDLLTMYDLYMNKENQEYNQYQDSMDRWYQEMARLQDNYDTLYNREYSEYEDKRNMAYDQYNADRDVAWNEYLRDLENQQTAAELLASTGNYDRLQEIYGFTDEEIAAIKKANTPTGGKGGGGNLLKPGTDAYNAFMTEINRASSKQALSNIIYSYQSMGYSLQSLNQIAANRIAELSQQNTEQHDTSVKQAVPMTSPVMGLGASGGSLSGLNTYLKLIK